MKKLIAIAVILGAATLMANSPPAQATAQTKQGKAFAHEVSTATPVVFTLSACSHEFYASKAVCNTGHCTAGDNTVSDGNMGMTAYAALHENGDRHRNMAGDRFNVRQRAGECLQYK